jgi:transposase
MQLDNGSFHKSLTLNWPENVLPIFQPAHSPELNPIERLWEHFKQTLRWENCNNLEQLRQKVTQLLDSTPASIIAPIGSWQAVPSVLALRRQSNQQRVNPSFCNSLIWIPIAINGSWMSFPRHIPDSLNILQVDNGRFHTSKHLVVPENIILLFQPPYSPKLNPIERLWEHLKADLKWASFKTLAQLQAKLINSWLN